MIRAVINAQRGETMKFKIFCVLVIAASIAVVLFLTLKGEGTNAPDAQGTLPPAATASTGGLGVKGQALPPEVPPAKELSAEELAQAAAAKKETMDKAAEVPVAENQVLTQAGERLAYNTDTLSAQTTPDEVEVIRSSVNDPMSYARLSPAKKTMAISLALNMNEEQEVMLTSYLEAQQGLFKSAQMYKLGNVLAAVNTKQYGTSSRFLPSLAETGDMIEIAAAEVKEVKNLRESFVGALTKQQQEKLSGLAIGQVF